MAVCGLLLARSLSAQCPSLSFKIDSIDKIGRIVYFTLQSDSDITANVNYFISSPSGYYNNTKIYNLVGTSISQSDTIHYLVDAPTIQFYVSFHNNDWTCYDDQSKTIDLRCEVYASPSFTPACESDFNKSIRIYYGYSYYPDSVQAIVKNKAGDPIDNFYISSYSISRTYNFTYVGFDTLRVTYKGEYCERTEDIPIVISGNCTDFSCSAALSLDSIGNRQYRLIANHPQANFYSWYISSPYTTLKKDTTSNSIIINTIDNTQYHAQVWVLNTNEFCYTSVERTFATSSCYAELNFNVDGYGTVYFYLTLPDPDKTYILDFGDGTDTTLMGGSYAYPNRIYPSGIYHVTLTVKDGNNVCNVISKDIEISTCVSLFSTYNSSDSVVVFYTSSSSSIYYTDVKFVFDFGDGQQYTTRTWGHVSHTYQNPGVYQVTLLTEFYSDSINVCSDIYTSTIIVGNDSPLVAKFSYTISGDTVYFYNNSIGNIASYQWDFGDGNYSAVKNPQHVYSSANVYKVCLTVKDNAGQINTRCKDITVGNPSCLIQPSFIASKSDTNLRIIKFTNLSQGGQSYYWDFGDGTISTAKNPIHKYARTGRYTVVLSVSDTVCSRTYSQVVEAGSFDCRAQFSLFSDASGNVSLSNTSLTAGINTLYYWNYGDGTFTLSANPSVKTYSRSGKYTITLVVYEPNTGCFDYAEKTVYIDKPCKAQFSYTVDTSANTIQLQNQSINAYKSYWFFSDGGYSTSTDPVHAFPAAGIYKVNLTITDTTSGCTDSYEQYVNVGQKNDCEADFIYLVNTATNAVQFFDISIGNIQSYLWNFGDGTTSTEKNPQKTYSVPKVYNVCLTVVNQHGISNITCNKVSTQSNACVADYDYQILSDRKVRFSDRSMGNPASYQWNFGDNNTGSGSQVNHAYAANGYYLTSLSISNGGSCNSRAYKLINVGMPAGIKAGIVANRQGSKNKAGGYPVDFIGAGLGDDVRIKWVFGDGTEDTTTTSPTHVYSTPGTYTACYIVSDPITGQSDTACTTITITSITHIAAYDNLQIYPVPFNDVLNVNLSLEHAANVQIILYDLSGRMVLTSNRKALGIGNNVVSLNTAAIKAGTYLLQVNIDGQVNKQLVVKQ
ncbi:MAG: PKD domain-containing protein [Bacteroidales bacterium]